jgi:3-hydroxypropanoate dehydrogenase
MQHTSPRIRGSITEQALDQLFRKARTHQAWLPDPVPIELVREAYQLARLGPTSANYSPGRFVVLTTPEAKARTSGRPWLPAMPSRL